MPDEKPIKLKLCLLGPGNVGKTSLIKKYVFDEFDDKYISTLGTKVTKKEMTVQHPNNGTSKDINLMIWDIMGQQGFRQLLQQSYFFGAHGIMGVCDVTKENTLTELHDWMRAAFGVTNQVPAVILGNKCDLSEQQEINLDDMNNFASVYDNSVAYLSSAKTGENVELAFKLLAQKIIEIVFD
ncbi:MAG: GTP-binding protein [Thermoplasmata archaeon]|nr:MAG: GTP-binding protein [Thermoplasmata archaeon]